MNRPPKKGRGMSRADKEGIQDAFRATGEDTEATRKEMPAIQGQVNAEALLDLIRQQF